MGLGKEISTEDPTVRLSGSVFKSINTKKERGEKKTGRNFL